MRKRPLIITTLMFSVCLLLFACRKDFKNFINDQQVSSDFLESAKVYHAKNSNKILIIEGNTYKLKPLWNESWTVKSGNERLLVVPTKENKVAAKDVKIRRVFLFSKSGTIVSSGKIVEFVGFNFDVNDKINDLIQNIDRPFIKNFDGAILQYNIKYYPEKNSVYEGGVKTNKSAGFVNSSGLEPRVNSVILNNSRATGGKISSIGSNKTLRIGKTKLEIPCSSCPTSINSNLGYGFFYIKQVSSAGVVDEQYSYIGQYNQQSSSGEGSGEGSGSGSGEGSGSGSGEGSGSGSGEDDDDDETPYGGGEECESQAAALMLGGSTASDLVDLSVSLLTTEKRKITVRWAIYKSPMDIWRYISTEVGYQTRTGSDPWVWESFTHESIVLEGTIIGWSPTFTETQTAVLQTLGPIRAYVTVYFSIRGAAVCKGSPFELDVCKDCLAGKDVKLPADTDL